MTQPAINQGATVYTMPYPQSYSEVQLIRAAELNSYMGSVSRDFHVGRGNYPLQVFLGWEDLTTAEMQTIHDAWRAMADDIDASWTYTGPTGDTYTAWLNPSQPSVQSTRYSGPSGTILFTARLSLQLD